MDDSPDDSCPMRIEKISMISLLDLSSSKNSMHQSNSGFLLKVWVMRMKTHCNSQEMTKSPRVSN